MLHLDHLTVIAPTLAEGVAHLRESLDLDVPFGRRHADMGTHNHRLRLGDDIYLEVIAIDPDGAPPAQARWFGLDDQAALRRAWDHGLRLRGWVASTDDIDAAIAGFEPVLGRKTRLNPAAPFFFAIPADGSLPLGGAAPSVIDRIGKPPAMAGIPDLGATLRSFVLEHPEPATIEALYRDLKIRKAPTVVPGPLLRYRAEIDTPSGLKTLT